MKSPQLALLAPASALALCSACASTTHQVEPGAQLDQVKRIYVQRHADDGRDIAAVIAEVLNEMGFEAASGRDTPSAPQYDAALTYWDRWAWDVTMYMSRLDIELRDLRCSKLLGRAEAFRGSLDRQTPRRIAQKLLYPFFGREVPPKNVQSASAGEG